MIGLETVVASALATMHLGSPTNANSITEARSIALSPRIATRTSPKAEKKTADVEVPKWNVSGHLDFYYQYDFGKPGVGADLVGRAFDVRNESFSLASAQINIVRAPTKSEPFGLTLNLVTGKNADLLVAARQPNETAYKLVQQAYGTYDDGKGLTIDFGKFTTWVGFEVLATPDNPNYSLSHLFNFGQPFWHAGLRASKKVSDKLAFTGAVVNGWNEVEDTNGAKSLGFGLVYTLDENDTFILNYLGGNEGAGVVNGSGFAALGEWNVQLVDFDYVRTFGKKFKMIFDGTYASATGNTAGATSGNWYGFEAHAIAELNDRQNLAIRYDTFKDHEGLRFFGLGNSGSLSSLTATWNYAVTPSSQFRVELRRDFASSNVFASDSGARSNRTTLTVAQAIRF